MLIEAGRRTGSLRRYVAVEVSRETAEAAAHSLHETYGKLDVHVVVGDFEGYVHWLDVNSGQLAARLRADNSAIVGAPLVVGDVVVVQTDDGVLIAFRLDPGSG